MADKGNIYYCRWEKNENGNYVGWEEKFPSRRAEAATPKELVSALGEVVGEYHNDHEAAIEFDPPLAIGEGKGALFKDEIVSLCWNANFWFRPSASTAFAGGRCQACKHGVGPRTSRPLIVDSFGGGTDGASADISMPGHLIIVTEAFLMLLTRDERALFDTRPVEWNPKRRFKFFEVIPKTFVPTVKISALEGGGWRCPVCGYKFYTHGGEALDWGIEVISRTDLPSSASPFFFVGNPLYFTLCASRQRWHCLRGQAGTRKLMSYPVAVVDEQECERDPWVPTSDQVEEFRRKHGFRVNYTQPNPPDGPLVPGS